MKKYLKLCFLIFQSLTLFSQNYDAVKNDGIYLFSNGNEVKAIRIDSLSTIGTDTIFYNFFSIQTVDSSFYCFNAKGPSWIGKQIIKKENGDFIFFNYHNDSIIIKTQAVVSESWKCFSYINGDYIEAYVNAISTISLLGVTDTIKTIFFQYKDSLGTPVSNAINNKKLRLSKSHGLIEIAEFYIFPNIAGTFNIFSGPNLQGKKNLISSEIYDYDINDEFLVESSYSYYDGQYHESTETSLIKILNKYVISTDTITYIWERCEKDEVRLDANVQTSYYHDTIVWTFIFTNPEYKYLDHLPEETILSTNNGASCITMDFSINNRLEKLGSPYLDEYCFISDSCWNYMNFNGCVIIDGSYIEGCGGPYYECTYGISHDYNRLKYYKKGNEVWGNPINCETILSINEFNPEDNISVELYPNPVSTNITIVVPVQSIIEISNIEGQIIKKAILDSGKTSIDVGDLSSGIYILKATTDKEIITKKIIKE